MKKDYYIAAIVIGVPLLMLILYYSVLNYNSNSSSSLGISSQETYSSSVSEEKQEYESERTYFSFSNKYGTSTTACAHSDCFNYIATSGDTNCCTTHSNSCSGCNDYIDEDALMCFSCIENALSK